ncbi:MAG: M1 family aminopeptidase [Acidobacteriota bacterium]
MFVNGFARRLGAGLMLSVLVFSSILSARPLNDPPFFQMEGKTGLPPVNWIRSRKIDVKHIAIDIRFDWDKEQALGTSTVTAAPFMDSDHIFLDAAAMTINSVKNASGQDLKFNYDAKGDNDNLDITLDRVYKGGEDVTVKVSYATNYVNSADADTAIGSFGRGLRFIKPTADQPNKPRQIWSQGESEFNRYWFPSYDSPNDFRTTELTATVAKPFTVISNGKLVSTKENADGTRTFDWKMDQPYSNYLTSIVVGEYKEVVQNFEGTPVIGYAYPNETKEVAATVKNLPATIKFFSDITGVRYPYAKYSQTFVEDFGGGMENISATTQIEEMIHDERELLDTDSESLQSHELGHQWFGDYVTCRDWGQIWLNESFATYMQAMWDEKLKGHEEFLYADIRDNHDQVLGSWNQGQRRPIVTKYYANKDAMFDNYAYPGGGSVLHMLRKHLGDKLFFASLKHYLTANAHQPVSTEELRIAVEETSGQSMDWFFDEWLYRMGHPVFEITQAYDDAAKKLTLDVKQTQKIDVTNDYPQTEFFQAFVDVEIDGRVERVWMKPQAENVFTFDSAAKPKLVNFDFESTMLKEMKFEKSTDELLYQMANDKDVLGRRWAMGELEKRASDAGQKPQIVSALITSAEKDSFWRIRRAALSTIANIYSPDPRPGTPRAAASFDPKVEQAVLRLAKDPQTLVKADAIKLLGETQDAKYVPLFISSLNDRSYGVIDESAKALGRSKSDKAYDALIKLTSMPSWKGRIQSAGVTGLAELGDSRAFGVAYKLATDAAQPVAVKRSAMVAIAATGKGDPRAFDLIFANFKRSLDNNSFQGVFSGAQAIIKLADPRGQEAFDLLKAKFKDQANILGFATQLESQFKAALKK